MSVQALTWVFENSQSKLADRHVLLSIANHAKNDGTGAWPSIATIARESRLSETSVHRSIRELVKTGELSVEVGQGPYGTNLYSINYVAKVPSWGGAKSDADLAPKPSLTVLSNNKRDSFKKPTKEQVSSYMKNLGIKDHDSQAEAFIDHHETRGWVPSGQRTQMKSWHHAVGTWKRNLLRFSNPRPAEREQPLLGLPRL